MKVIEFLGMPRAGKSTQIDLLKDFLQDKGQRVAILTDRERAQKIATPPTEGLAYTMVFFSQAIDAYYQFRDRVDYLLIDRGFTDVGVWADVRYALKEITVEEREALKKCFKPFVLLVDQIIYFQAPIDLALNRHQKTTQEAVDNVAMNRSWLELLEVSYQSNKKEFQNCLTIDGSETIETIQTRIREIIL